MVFNLGKKYEQIELEKGRTVLNSFVITLAQVVIAAFFLLLVFSASIMSEAFIFTLLIAVILIVLLMSRAFNSGVLSFNIGSIRLYRYTVVALYFLVILPFLFYTIFFILGNYVNYEFFNSSLKEDFNFDLIANIKTFIVQSKEGILIGKLNVPAVLFVFVITFALHYLLVSIVLINYRDLCYIASEKRVYKPVYSYTLVDDGPGVNLVTYQYLSKLALDDQDYLEPNLIYYDIYIYGEEDLYFYVESYSTKLVKRKVKKLNVVKSDIFAYDIDNFQSDEIQTY